MQTQSERLLGWLQRNRRINPLEAWIHLGIYRLGARVFDLRRQGHQIKSGTATVKNRYGEKCRVAEYELQQ